MCAEKNGVIVPQILHLKKFFERKLRQLLIFNIRPWILHCVFLSEIEFLLKMCRYKNE